VHLDLIRDKSRVFPPVQNPEGVASLTVWHCKYKTLAPLQTLGSLRELTIATFPDESFELLASLVSLEELRIMHFPRVSSLAPLAKLQSLRRVILESLPSWDASNKRLIVESIEPLATLPQLECLQLLGVVPESRSLAALEASKSLRFARFHGYKAAEQSRFFSSAPQVKLAPSEA
jgi:hypothetical protein